jgi:integrase
MKIQQGYLTEESGAWIGHYSKWVLDPRTGEKKRRQLAFKIGALSALSTTEAREKLRERIVEELGLDADSRVTLAGFMESRWKPLREGTWRESTKQTNEELLKVIVARFGSVALENMDAVAMQSWLNTLAKDRSGSVVRHLRIFLMSIMKEAHAQGYIRRDVARSLRVPRLKPVKREYLTEEEIKTLLDAAKYQLMDRALLRLMLVTGMRPSELFALRWSCLSADYSTLTLVETVYRGVLRPFTKTTEEGDTEFVSVFVPKVVADALSHWHTKAKHNGAQDFIFATESGACWWKENYQQRVLNPLADRAEVKRFNFQMLRRSMATHAQHTGSPKDIQMMLRHRKPGTAQEHYVQAIDKSVRAATEKLASALLK